MSEAKHTPGPWSWGRNTRIDSAVDPDVYPFQIAEEMWAIAEVYGDVHDIPAQANAHLISAAPELLEAARKALALVGKMRSDSNTDGVTSALMDAIAKAEGRS